MGCRPHLDPMIEAKLKQIRREYFVKWNSNLDNWEIWGRTPMGKYYQIMRVKNNDGSYRPLDARTMNHMRFLRWMNQSPEVFRRETRKLLDEEEQRKVSKENTEYNNVLGIGESLYRPYQMFARDMGWSSGKSKIPTVQGTDFK